jgi:D-alanyl-D-alanine carboxypeptidase (penicillin-binding protein 5/6)
MKIISSLYHKKICLVTCLVFLIFSVEARSEKVANNTQDESQFYFLIDADTKEVLLAKNPDVRIPPSSMTKMMTAYVVFDQISKGRITLSNQCLIGKDAWRKSGSSMFLNYGDVVTVEELIKGLLAVSGNDAAIALAESTSGGMNNFVALMNEKAKELGLTNSHFKNPHGLYEEDHYMSVRDIATLAIRICQDFPQYSKYLGIPEFTYRNITQKNRNPLIKENYEGVIGGKTGHTNEGGYGVIGIVKRDNRRLIAVINKVKTPTQRAKAITKIFDYGFLAYKKLVIFQKNQTVINLKTWLGDKIKIDAITNQEIALNIPRDKALSAVKVKVQYLEPLYTPIAEGTKIANLIVEIDGYKTLEYPLFAKEKIGKAGYFNRIIQVLRYKISNFL